MNNIPFDITREEVLDLAAQKLVEAFADESTISDTANSLIRERVDKAFASKLNARIDDFLTAELEKLMAQEIVPVNMWGEREGKPTTMRAALAERARKFWEVRVDGDGRENSYGGTPRHEALMKQLLKDEFAKAVAENAEVIVAEFKQALLVDSTKLVTAHIDKLINVKQRR